MVVTLPRPFSSRASSTVPCAGPLTTAENSNTSAVNVIASNKASIPSPV